MSDQEAESGSHEVKRHRSPNYPAINLQRAIERADELFKKYKRNYVPVNLAHELWGYKAGSGLGIQTVAALSAFGLIASEGEAKNRKIRITDDAYRIVLNGPDRSELLGIAAIAPTLHKELWERYSKEMPADEILRHYLLFDRESGTFNPDVVDSFIDNYRDSLTYAKLIKADIKIGQDGSAYEGDDEPLPRPPLTKNPGIGDFVQWFSDRKYQYPQPRRVQGLSKDGQWVFIEGDNEARPIDEVMVMTPASEQIRGSQNPPQNPFRDLPKKAPQQDPSDSWSGPKIRFDLPRGNVIEIRLKSKVNQQEYEKIQKIFELSEFAFLEDAGEQPEPDEV